MRRSRLAVALAVAAALVTAGTGGVFASGADRPADPLAGDAVAGATSQATTTTVTDDTGTISIDVPVGWTVETAPTYYWGFYEVVPLGLYPTINAYPPGAEPGAGSWLVAQAFPIANHGDVRESFFGDFGVGCDPSTFRPEIPFDNGVLAGEQNDVVGCYGVARHTITADHGASFTVAVDALMMSAADEAAVAPVLSTVRPLTDTPITEPIPVEGNEWIPLPDRIGDFRTVEQFGTEPVRGTGCGSNGEIGETIPDGTWAALVPEINGGAVKIDLLCVYLPDAASGILADGSATIVNNDPNYLVVNNSTRLRVAPTGAPMELYDYATDASGACVAGPYVDGLDHSNRQAWVEIAGGAVVAIAWDCVALDGVPATGGGQGNLPPAEPDGGMAVFWPYGEFWNVPQLGTERVRGSGCGGSGEIGDQIPDGLWAGFVSVDPANPDEVWVNLLCVYYGESAQAVRDAGTANIIHDEPDYLIVNNNPQNRVLANRITAVAASAPDPSGRCVPMGEVMPPAGEHLPGAVGWLPGDPSTHQAWIRVDGGAVTWLVYGCDSGFAPGG